MLNWSPNSKTQHRYNLNIGDTTIHIEHAWDGWRIYDGRLFGGELIANNFVNTDEAKTIALQHIRTTAQHLIEKIDMHNLTTNKG